MKIYYGQIKKAARDVFHIYFERFRRFGRITGPGNFKAYVYSTHYRSDPSDSERETPTNGVSFSTGAPESTQQWQRNSVDFAKRLQNLRRKPIFMQVNRPGSRGVKSIRNVYTDLQPNDRVSALGEILTFGPINSRLQVTVDAGSCGTPLLNELKSMDLDQYGIIARWKVMNPGLGATGPDSCVLYLTLPLIHAHVDNLINALAQRLGGSLRPIRPAPPLGLQEMHAGIFGCDLLDEETANRLSLDNSGSAGGLMASLIDLIGHRAAERVFRLENTKEADYSAIDGATKIHIDNAMGGYEVLLLNVARDLIEGDLDWELELTAFA